VCPEKPVPRWRGIIPALRSGQALLAGFSPVVVTVRRPRPALCCAGNRRTCWRRQAGCSRAIGCSEALDQYQEISIRIEFSLNFWLSTLVFLLYNIYTSSWAIATFSQSSAH